MIGLLDKVYRSKFHSQVTTNGLDTLLKRQQEGKVPGVHEKPPGLAAAILLSSHNQPLAVHRQDGPRCHQEQTHSLHQVPLGTPTLKYTCFSAKPPPEGSRQVTLGALREPTMTAVVEAWSGVAVGPQNSARKSWEEKSLEHR